MKKAFFLVVILAIVPLGAFAVDVGIGGMGGYATWKTTVPYINDEYRVFTDGYGGVFAFLDATYLELNLAYLIGTHNVAANFASAADASLFLKYPFLLGTHFRLFPLLGVSYTYVLSGEMWDGVSDKPSDASFLGFLGGLGLDIALTPGLYLRTELLYNMRQPSLGLLHWCEAYGSEAPAGHGFRAKAALGFAL